MTMAPPRFKGTAACVEPPPSHLPSLTRNNQPWAWDNQVETRTRRSKSRIPWPRPQPRSRTWSRAWSRTWSHHRRGAGSPRQSRPQAIAKPSGPARAESPPECPCVPGAQPSSVPNCGCQRRTQAVPRWYSRCARRRPRHSRCQPPVLRGVWHASVSECGGHPATSRYSHHAWMGNRVLTQQWVVREHWAVGAVCGGGSCTC